MRNARSAVSYFARIATAFFCAMTIAATPTTTTTVTLPAPPPLAPAAAAVEFAWFEYQGWETPRAEPRPDEFLNPILAGFYPDPSICRVGDEFFLVNSTFAWYPGVPIFRSRDLVNWSQIGHVLDRPSQLNLDGRGVSEGIFAPTIQHHDGVFYVATTLVGSGGNFYVTAKDPAGPWSEPKWLKDVDGIDPSFFFDDDGRTYLIHNGPPPDDKPLYPGHRTLWLHEFDVGSGVTRAGSGKIIVNGGTDIAKTPVWIEAPHLFKRGGFYYLFAAEGGTGTAHAEVVFRSRNVWGPYEPLTRPILTQSHLSDARPLPVTCTGHADFVETATGEWWAVFLGCRPYERNLTNIGRETFLLPMRWVDGWPIVLGGEDPVPRVLKRPNLPAQPPADVPHNGSFTWRDEFESAKLAHVWNFLRTPRQTWYSLDRKPGSLLIEPRPVELTSRGNPSLIARRQQHANFIAATRLTPSDDPRADAGLVAFQNETHYFFLGSRVDRDGRGEIFLERSAGKQTSDGPEIIARAAVPAQPADAIELRLRAVGKSYSFSYRLAGDQWISLREDADGSILSTDCAGGFVGSYLGMFARTRAETP